MFAQSSTPTLVRHPVIYLTALTRKIFTKPKTFNPMLSFCSGSRSHPEHNQPARRTTRLLLSRPIAMGNSHIAPLTIRLHKLALQNNILPQRPRMPTSYSAQNMIRTCGKEHSSPTPPNQAIKPLDIIKSFTIAIEISPQHQWLRQRSSRESIEDGQRVSLGVLAIPMARLKRPKRRLLLGKPLLQP